MSLAIKDVYHFDEFVLDPSRRTLARNGNPVSVSPKAFEVLTYLVVNSGRVVTKDELLKAVWPDSFVEESNLAQHISWLRKALGDKSNDIVTVPGRGYQFTAHVRTVAPPDWLPASQPGEILVQGVRERTHMVIEESFPASLPAKTAPFSTRSSALIGLAALAVCAGWLWLSPTPPPAVLKINQLTHFGRVHPASRLVTDGTRIYFDEVRGGRSTLAAVSVNGGEPAAVPTPFPKSEVYGISPDHSELLVGSYPGGPPEPELWMVSTTGGSPRRVGNVHCRDAAWSPDGQKIAYFSGSGLYLVKPDGSDRRQLATTEGSGRFSRWSPDGHTIRFSTFDSDIPSLSLWEVNSTGGNIHRLLSGWREPPAFYGDGESDGDWTPDGNYFVFRSTRAGVAGIWAIAETRKFLRPSSRTPVQLTTTDSSLWSLLATQNKIFYAGDKEVRELARCDGRLKQFVPYLPGVRARDVDFSRDGQWVAYVVPNMQENILWRSRVDGSDRQQLTFPPMQAMRPRWSPDGRKIAFAGSVPTMRARIFVISPAGGEPEPVTPAGLDSTFPDWSPGGDLLFFSAPVSAAGGLLKGENGGTYQLDLKTKRLSVFPGAEALIYACWSPGGRYLVAQSRDGNLMLFDSASRQWSELAQGTTLRAPVKWSRDSKYAYSQDVEGSQPILRARISDGKIEPIVTFEQIPRADVRSYALTAVAPDGSLVVSLVLSHSDIYALEVNFP